MKTTCNNCLDEFELEADKIKTVTMEGIEIQYFLCPSCGYKYVVFATNEELKRLVEERQQLQKQYKAARAGHYRKKTIGQLIMAQKRLIRRQKRLWAELKPKAELLLRGVKT